MHYTGIIVAHRRSQGGALGARAPRRAKKKWGFNPDNNLSVAQRCANHNFIVGNQRWAIVDLLVGETLGECWDVVGKQWWVSVAPTSKSTMAQRRLPMMSQR